MLKALLQEIKGKCCPTKIVATHKMTEPQKKLWKEYTKKADEAIKLRDESITLKKKFWNKVEGDLQDFDHQLKVNEEDMTIEVHEDDCEDCDKE